MPFFPQTEQTYIFKLPDRVLLPTAKKTKKKPVQYLHDSVLQLTNKKQKALVHYLQDGMLQLTKLLVQYLRGSTSQLHPVK